MVRVEGRDRPLALRSSYFSIFWRQRRCPAALQAYSLAMVRVFIIFLLSLSVFAEFADRALPVLEMHCYDCHDAETKKGDLDLSALPHADYGEAEAAIWATALDLVNAGDMPPKKKARLDADELGAITGWLETSLAAATDRLRNERPPTQLRRLNRLEYRNTIRDLTGHPFDAAELFTRDTASHGFDNVGEALQISTLQMEGYVAAAERVVGKILAVPAKAPVRQHWRIVSSAAPGEALKPKNGAWHDGHLDKPKDQIAPGRLKEKPLPNAEIPNGSAPYHMLDLSAEPPKRYAGSWDIRAFGGSGGRGSSFGFKWFAYDEGRYRVRLNVSGIMPPTDTYPPVLSVSLYPEGTIWREFPVPAGDHSFEFELYRDAIAWYVKTSGNRHWGMNLHFPLHRNQKPTRWGVEVRSIEIEGPLYESWPPAWHRDLMGERQEDETAWARDILERFMTRAFRRPVSEAELARVLGMYTQERAKKPFRASLRLPLSTVLCSPAFLYIGGTPQAPSAPAYALASRLSYFLWRSMPDTSLFSDAASGELFEPDVLQAHVNRMLADPRSQTLGDSFAQQWLGLGKLQHFEADQQLFPRFRPMLRDAMRAESTAFFAKILADDMSVMQFVDSDFLMLNDIMARHYGITGVEGTQFRPVPLEANHQRGGVLTQASVLTATANGVRTLPVTRGAFILEQILGDPPPPPPPDVGQLEDIKPPHPNATTRERLELHRQDPTCARCHNKIDPLGFALEHFDPIGQWRSKEPGGGPIDAAGAMPNGRTFADSAALKKLLLANPDAFIDSLSEKLLIYALDRPMGFSDRPLIREVRNAAKQDGATLRAIITQIVSSKEFRN
ncbi:MAG: hypothetical protein ACI8W8_001870 [Rhodothermales bacterium]